MLIKLIGRGVSMCRVAFPPVQRIASKLRSVPRHVPHVPEAVWYRYLGRS